MKIILSVFIPFIICYSSIAQEYKNYIVPFEENCTSTGLYFDNENFIIPCLYSGQTSSIIVTDTYISNIQYYEYDSINISFRPLNNLSDKRILYGKNRPQSNDLRSYLLNDDFSINSKVISEEPFPFTFPTFSLSIKDNVYNGFIFDLMDGAIRRIGIQKIDAEGNMEYSKHYNSEIELSYLWSMTASLNENIILSAGIHYFNQLGRYSQITKLDTDGNELWKYEGTEAFDNGATPAWIAQLSDSSIVQSYEINKWGDVEFALQGFDLQPTRLIWLSKDGELLQEKLLTVPKKHDLHFFQIEAGLGDYFYAYGEYRDDENDQNFGLITKYSNAGDTIWTHRYRHPDYAIDGVTHRIVDLIEMDNSDVVVLGSIQPPGENQEIWIFRVNSDGCFGGNSCNEVVTNVKENLSGANYITLSPNPTTGIINIPNELATYTSINVIDQMGKVSLIIEKGEAQIDISELSSGIYFIRFQFDLKKDVYSKMIKTE